MPSKFASLWISSSKQSPSFASLETARAAAVPSPHCPHPASAIVIVAPMLVLLSFQGYCKTPCPAVLHLAFILVTHCGTDSAGRQPPMQSFSTLYRDAWRLS